MAVASRWKASDNRPLHGLTALAVAALLLLSLLVAAVAFLWPRDASTRGLVVEAGYLHEIPLRQPIYFERGNFWLVKLDDESVVALSAVNPHATGCHLAWGANFVFNGATGWFRDPCVGATFDLAGNRIFGPAPRNMDRYEVQIGSELPGQGALVRVYADEAHLTRGNSTAGSSGISTPIRR